MNHLSSGPKRILRERRCHSLPPNRDGRTPEGQSPVVCASVLMLLYGRPWKTLTEGDNPGLIATDR